MFLVCLVDSINATNYFLFKFSLSFIGYMLVKETLACGGKC